MKNSILKKIFILSLAACLLLCFAAACGSADNNTENGVKPAVYRLVVDDMWHGKATAEKSEYRVDETVTVTVTPDEGYSVVTFTVNDTAVDVANGKATFKMPAENVTVCAIFARTVDISSAVTESCPGKGAFTITAESARQQVTSVWTAVFAADSLQINVWVRDAFIYDTDGVRIYLGSGGFNRYLTDRNLSLRVLADGSAVTYIGNNGNYAESDADITAAVTLWSENGSKIDGYKVSAEVQYSALNVTSDTAKRNVCMMPELIVCDHKYVGAECFVRDGHAAEKPFTYDILTDDNTVEKSAYFGGAGQLGDGTLAAGRFWNTDKDYFDIEDEYSDRTVTLNGHDGADNNLFFYDTLGAETVYAEATFRVTEIFDGERYGKFGIMLFDGASQTGLYFYADAGVGEFSEPVIDNITGTKLGYNIGNGERNKVWNELPNTEGAFDLEHKTVTLKMAYKDGKAYLWCGDDFVAAVNYAVREELCIGIKSFAYGLAVTDYYAATDPADIGFARHLPVAADLGGAVELGGDETSATSYTIDFDFEIESGNQGFAFGMTDKNNFVMWQVGAPVGENGIIQLTPHILTDGNWTILPAADITDGVVGALGIADKNEFLHKTVHERIEVRGTTVNTYFGLPGGDLSLVNTVTLPREIRLEKLGFRQDANNIPAECAYFDNITVKNVKGVTVYAHDFEDGEIGFGGSLYAENVGGRLKVGTTENIGLGAQILMQGAKDTAKRDDSFTVEFEFGIASGNQGFMFGYQNDANFIMWQFNTDNNNIRLRPHFRVNGQWDVREFDILESVKAALGITSVSDIIGMTVFEKIVVEKTDGGTEFSTYIGTSADSMTLINKCSYEKWIMLGKIGFRQSAAAREVVFYDNILIKSCDGATLYSNDFSKDTAGISGQYMELADGKLKVGTDSGSGDQLYVQDDEIFDPPTVKTGYTKKFDLSSDPTDSVMYLDASGGCELVVNGIAVQNYTVSVTTYGRRIRYYDISEYLTVGENIVTVQTAGASTVFMANISIYLGSETVSIITDSSWSVGV